MSRRGRRAEAPLAACPPVARVRGMDLHLPIAGLSVNWLVIVGLGGLVGLLTGMVGVASIRSAPPPRGSTVSTSE